MSRYLPIFPWCLATCRRRLSRMLGALVEGRRERSLGEALKRRQLVSSGVQDLALLDITGFWRLGNRSSLEGMKSWRALIRDDRPNTTCFQTDLPRSTISPVSNEDAAAPRADKGTIQDAKNAICREQHISRLGERPRTKSEPTPSVTAPAQRRPPPRSGEKFRATHVSEERRGGLPGYVTGATRARRLRCRAGSTCPSWQ